MEQTHSRDFYLNLPISIVLTLLVTIFVGFYSTGKSSGIFAWGKNGIVVSLRRKMMNLHMEIVLHE